MAPVSEPLDAHLARRLRGLVARLFRRTARTRAGFPLRVCVGDLAAVAPASFTVRPEDRLDLDSRTEILSALLDAVRSARGAHRDPVPWIWLERRGTPHWHDADAAWLAAAAQAAGEADADLGFVVVTRRGWYDPRSTVRREWARPRA